MDAAKMKEKVQSFIYRGEIINKKERHKPDDGIIMTEYVSGPLLDEWISEISVFNERYLKLHPLYQSIGDICKKYKRVFSPCDELIGKLKALLADEDFWKENGSSSNVCRGQLSEKDELLSILVDIYNSGQELYISDNDNRVSHINNYQNVLKLLNNEGFFSAFKEDVIGGFEIELSEKTFNSNVEDRESTKLDIPNVTNIFIAGDVHDSNLSTGENTNQELSNQYVPNSKKSFFEKYWLPIIIAIIGAVATIIAAIVK